MPTDQASAQSRIGCAGIGQTLPVSALANRAIRLFASASMTTTGPGFAAQSEVSLLTGNSVPRVDWHGTAGAEAEVMVMTTREVPAVS
jgi:hypothetical protein